MTTRHFGFSLVELLVAMAIGLIGILMISHVYLTGERYTRSTLGESGAQTNGLTGLYMVERELRNAGYGIAESSSLGCGQIFWYYEPNYSPNITPGSPLPELVLAPVVIRTAAGTPDQITVMLAGGNDRILPGTVTGFNKSSSEVTVDTLAGYKVNDLILLVNGGGCTVAKITNIQVVPKKLQLNPGATGKYNPAAWGLFPTNHGTGDLIVNLGSPVARTYSVANGRLQLAEALLQTAGATAPVAVMEGIVDLRAQYGKDNGTDNGTVEAASYAPNDGRVDQFSSLMPANGAEWQQVLSVRVGILARIGSHEKPSTPGGACDATTAAPAWAGGTFAALDIATLTSQDRCYRYRVFETTIPLRNMVWRAT